MGTFLLIGSFPESLVRFRGDLLRDLLARGLRVHVAAPDLSASSAVASYLASMGVVVHHISLGRTGTSPLMDLKTLLSLYRLMRAVKPDYCLAYTVKPVVYGSIAARWAKVPRRFALVTGLGYAFAEGGSRRSQSIGKLVQKLYRVSLSQTHKVFFQNPDDARLFRALGLVPSHASLRVVNGSGVNLHEYAPSPLPDRVTFILIARLLGAKGVREYAEAARIVKSRYPEVRFRLAGWIDDNPDSICQSELDGWINNGTLEFLGRLQDVRQALADSTVFVLPSYREGIPRSVLEAMAMGRAVITTDAPGCRETVSSNENGFVVPVGEVSDMAALMARFAEDPELAVRMGAASRRIAEERYDVRKVNEIMLSEMGIL